MLIIDMPMPENCRSCPFSSSCSFCEGYDDYCVLAPKDAKYEWNFSDGKEPKERPSWCLIKGELVRCRECRYYKAFDDGTYGHCIISNASMMKDWYCRHSKRKEQTDAID